jgi:hypothetical protein
LQAGYATVEQPEGKEPVLEGEATLYTRQGPVLCEMYSRPCLAETCKITFQEVAEAQSIFFFSSHTAAGDEIGWDFISWVKRGRITFTGFCKEMTRRYRTNNVGVAPFMSGTTFISWFFSWLSAMKIDFRKEVDPVCNHQPKILACDGTHIGVSSKYIKLDKPVTGAEKNETVKPIHKRYNRVLLPDKVSRLHLKYLCRKELSKLKPGEELSPEEEVAWSNNLMTNVEQVQDLRLSNFIQVFVQKKIGNIPIHANILHWMAKLLLLLACDAATSSVVPFCSHVLLTEVCNTINNHGYGTAVSLLKDLRKYSVEFSQLLTVCQTHSLHCQSLCVDFAMFLMEHVKEIHRDDHVAPPAIPIPGTYNPASGVAYYFTEHGQQIRTQPRYDISGSANYDDRPQVDEGCNKLFPRASLGGYGYVFLWFCPIHGHSYGFHLIDGSEGRKDPFSSLFKYCERAPEEIFFDFACQLSEYCLNREPDFYLLTRFWHDLFHSVGHVCGDNFKSGRVEGLLGLNTEICEQVNSYLQCIKYTASHLSQAHMVFFLQFFLYLWNKDKTSKFQRQASVAIAGLM